ncbi:hypothetical protein FXO37_30262 [Capsicum annuum]|nr:hypothetical protein FXO37_30262 [Capsicum annuum]
MKTLVRTSLLSSSNRFLCRDMKSLKVIFSGPQINVFLYHRLVGNYIAAIHGVDLSNIEIDFTCGLYYDLIRNIEGWLRDHTAQVKILKLNLEEEGSLDQVLYRISFPFAVRTSRTLVHLSLSTSRHIRLITLSQHWDVPTLKEVSLCGFSLNGEDGVIGGCHNIERLTLQSCCYGGPNEIMKLVLNKLWVLKIEDWNYRGNHSKFSVNVDAPLLIDLILVKHSSNLMFARPMNLKFVMFSLKKYRVVARKGEADTRINVAHTHIITLEDDGHISNVGIQHMALKFIQFDHSFNSDERCRANALRLSCYLNNAACKLKVGEHQEASKMCSKVIEYDPCNVKALFRRAQAYLRINELEKAEIDIKKALQVDPNNRDVKVIYKEMKNKQKQYAQHEVKIFSTMLSRLA